jgi:hypothetical protein
VKTQTRAAAEARRARKAGRRRMFPGRSSTRQKRRTGAAARAAGDVPDSTQQGGRGGWSDAWRDDAEATDDTVARRRSGETTQVLWGGEGIGCTRVYTPSRAFTASSASRLSSNSMKAVGERCRGAG